MQAKKLIQARTRAFFKDRGFSVRGMCYRKDFATLSQVYVLEFLRGGSAFQIISGIVHYGFRRHQGFNATDPINHPTEGVMVHSIGDFMKSNAGWLEFAPTDDGLAILDRALKKVGTKMMPIYADITDDRSLLAYLLSHREPGGSESDALVFLLERNGRQRLANRLRKVSEAQSQEAMQVATMLMDKIQKAIPGAIITRGGRQPRKSVR